MHVKVLRKLWIVVKCKVFIFLESEHVHCENMLSTNSSGPEPAAPARRQSSWCGYPYRSLRDRSAQEPSRQGRASQELPEAGLGFPWWGSPKNNTQGLKEAPSWRWFITWAPQWFRSLVWQDPGTSNHLPYDLNSSEKLEDNPVSQALRCPGSSVSHKGPLPSTSIRKKSCSGPTQAKD